MSRNKMVTTQLPWDIEGVEFQFTFPVLIGSSNLKEQLYSIRMYKCFSVTFDSLVFHMVLLWVHLCLSVGVSLGLHLIAWN